MDKRFIIAVTGVVILYQHPDRYRFIIKTGFYTGILYSRTNNYLDSFLEFWVTILFRSGVLKIDKSVIRIGLQQADTNLLAYPEPIFSLYDPSFGRWRDKSCVRTLV